MSSVLPPLAALASSVWSPAAAPARAPEFRWDSDPFGGSAQAAWRASAAQRTDGEIEADPIWCRAIDESYPGSVQLLHLTIGPGAAAPASVVFQHRRSDWDCQLGEWRWARFHPRLLRLHSIEPGLRYQPQAIELLLEAVLANPSPWHAFSFTAPTDSCLWRLPQLPAAKAAGLVAHRPSAPAPRHWIVLPPTFADYAAKFTAKTRKNRLRELKLLEQQGPVELIKFSRPDQVDEFLCEAQAISQLSYQHRLMGMGLRHSDRLRPRLLVAAQQGWLRAYVLRCSGLACSYMLGYQYQGVYHYVKVGYRPDWAKWCVGTALQWLVLQEMYECNPPWKFDFGANGPQKQYFGNAQAEEGTLVLFRPGTYPALIRHAQRLSQVVTGHAAAWLDRHQLKPMVQRGLRRLHGC